MGNTVGDGFKMGVELVGVNCSREEEERETKDKSKHTGQQKKKVETFFKVSFVALP